MCDVIDIQELNDPCSPNAGGCEDELFYALASDFVSIPAAPISETVLRNKFIITTAPVFKTGKAWKKIQAKSNSVKSDYEGGSNSGIKKGTLSFSIAGNNPDANALFNISDGNTPYVFLVKPNATSDSANPDYELLGSIKQKAVLTAKYSSGEVTGDGAMYSFEAMCSQKFKVQYKAAIVLTPAA